MNTPVSFYFAPREAVKLMGMTEEKFKDHANFLLLSCADHWTYESSSIKRLYMFFKSPENELQRHLAQVRIEFLDAWIAAKNHIVSHLNGNDIHGYAATLKIKGNPLGLYSIYPKPRDGINPIEFIIEEA